MSQGAYAKKKTINSFATLLDFQANMYHSMKLCNNTHEMGTFAKKIQLLWVWLSLSIVPTKLTFQ